MSGGSISKKLGTSWECPNQGSHNCTLRRCIDKRREYRRLTHLERKESDNEKNRRRYHERYKADPVLMKRRKESWKEFAKRKGKVWQRERSKRYRKPYSELSDAQRSKIRNAYTQWANRNWGKRVEYARHYRRQVNPSVGIARLISAAKRSGSFGDLIQRLGESIARLDEAGHGQRGQPRDRKRGVRMRERNP